MRGKDFPSLWKAAPGAFKRQILNYDKLSVLVARLHAASVEEAAVRIEEAYAFENYRQFVALFLFTGIFVQSLADFRQLLPPLEKHLATNNIVYAEVSVGLSEYVDLGLDPVAVLEVLLNHSAQSSCHLRWIIDLGRNYGQDVAIRNMGPVIAMGHPHIIGITLGGDEVRYPPEAFAKLYALAHEYNLALSVHSGERAGPESIWRALQTLRPQRLGHGFQCYRDPRLMEFLAERRIPLEICMSANIALRNHPANEVYPIKTLYDHGVLFTMNTDDPAFVAPDLGAEYLKLLQLGFGLRDVETLMQQSIELSRLDEVEKRELRRCIGQGFRSQEGLLA